MTFMKIRVRSFYGSSAVEHYKFLQNEHYLDHRQVENLPLDLFGPSRQLHISSFQGRFAQGNCIYSFADR